ncbi:MAG TPA: hypothetical protein VHT91_24485 [Kofleriaceae bacterium]|jgi:hypothetical protein|nr:hypothetical protein [Kofleriaceae bacterium]
MTRVLRLIIPVSLCGLFTSAAILACHHRSDAPTTARPEATTPSTEPAPPVAPNAEGNPMTDGGMGTQAPPPGGAHAVLEQGAVGGPGVLLASQPVTPGPTGAPPPPGTPSPNPPTPSPNAPSPAPSPPPGTPPNPGAPSSPTGPSQPSPTPGMPQTPAPGTPTQTPRDAGVGDALTPPVPPISDAGVRIDSGMSPVLRRDAR